MERPLPWLAQALASAAVRSWAPSAPDAAAATARQPAAGRQRRSPSRPARRSHREKQHACGYSMVITAMTNTTDTTSPQTPLGISGFTHADLHEPAALA